MGLLGEKACLANLYEAMRVEVVVVAIVAVVTVVVVMVE